MGIGGKEAEKEGTNCYRIKEIIRSGWSQMDGVGLGEQIVVGGALWDGHGLIYHCCKKVWCLSKILYR